MKVGLVVENYIKAKATKSHEVARYVTINNNTIISSSERVVF